ncbi:MAG: hypothetical protein IT464_14995 [Planctomycetes bacterium]|nr:hypothetical protein [Planctomycetota bacterium]
MPQQAILDLPIIEFEPFRASPDRLHAQCIETYGINGLAPHADAAFHFGASLWRYREAESPKQVAGVAAGYLDALSLQVAARRRLAAARAGTRNVGRIEAAEEELDNAVAHLEDVTRLVLDFVGDMLEQAATEPQRASRRLAQNIDAMAEPGWSDELEECASGFVQSRPRIRWQDDLVDVLDALEEVELPRSKGNGHNLLDDRLVQRLHGELQEYREIATTASSRLQAVDSERRELERLLSQTESDFSSRSVALDEVREELEHTLGEARKRLEALEQMGSAAAGPELEKLRAERDRLADELLNSLNSATETETSREELIEHLEQAATDRVQAADAIGSLSKRLDAVQRDAEATAERADAYRQRMAELEDQVDELRRELSDAEQRNQQAQAVIAALENAEGRNSEFESFLTDAEARLADTEARLEDSQLRVDALSGELDDTRYELEKAREKLAQQKSNLDSISGQLAEAETLAGERDDRINELERENDRLRRDLSDAQTRMLDAKGDMDDARATEQNLQVELKRLNERISEEKGKAERALRDKELAATALQAARNDLATLTQSRDALAEQTRNLEAAAAESEKNLRVRDRELKALRDKLAAAEAQSAAHEAALTQAKKDLRAFNDAAAKAEKTSAEATSVRAKTDAELKALRDSATRTKADLADALAEKVLLQNQLAEVREELLAARDLAKDRNDKLSEKLKLMSERLQRQDDEKRMLMDNLTTAENNRRAEKDELEAVVQRTSAEVTSARVKLQSANADMKRLQDKLNETETFLIARQRELEKSENRFRSLIDEVGGVADLRTQYEKATSDTQREKLASQISKRIDSLFSAAGKPVHADRRTEKILILHVKKSDAEVAADSDKPFVATKRADNSNANAPSADTAE